MPLVDPYNINILVPGFIYVKNAVKRDAVRVARFKALTYFLRAYRHPSFHEEMAPAEGNPRVLAAAAVWRRTFSHTYIVAARIHGPTPVPRSDTDKTLILSSRRKDTANAGAMYGVPDLRPYVPLAYSDDVDPYARAWVDWFNFLSCPQWMYSSPVHRSSVQTFSPDIEALSKGPRQETQLDVDDLDTLLFEVTEANEAEIIPVVVRGEGYKKVPLPEASIDWIERLDKEKRLVDMSPSDLTSALDYLSYVRRLVLDKKAGTAVASPRTVPIGQKLRTLHHSFQMGTLNYPTALAHYKTVMAAFNARPALRAQGYKSPINRGKTYMPRVEALTHARNYREMVANEAQVKKTRKRKLTLPDSPG